MKSANQRVDDLNPFNDIKPLDMMGMFTCEPAPLDMVLRGLVIGTIGPLLSPGGVGKSMFSAQLGLQIATGRDTLGLGNFKRGRVVIFAGEDPKEAIHHRLHSMYKHFALTEKEIADAVQSLTIIPTVGKTIDLMNHNTMSGIKSIVDGARIVIFDTLTRYHGLDENKAEDAKRIMSTLEELAYLKKAAIIYPHHVSKASVGAGMAELQQAARGSSVFVDNARWSSFMAVMTKEEAKKLQLQEEDRLKFVKWNVNKQNYAEPEIEKWLERKRGGILSPANFTSTYLKSKKYSQASQKGGSDEKDW